LKKITIHDIMQFKKTGKKFATITAYDFTTTQIIEHAEIPLILVGDSASMTIYGYDTTIPISMEEMLFVIKAVTRAAQSALIIGDMPFLSYQTSIADAVKNAGILIKDGGVGAVKLEGGQQIQNHIKEIVGFGIPVMGHVGLTPQSVHQMSGYKIQGKTSKDAQKIIEDALAVEEAGAFSVVLECIPEELAQKITEKLSIPTVGIGSGNVCDGQIQVFHDVVGFSKNPAPKHAMKQTDAYTIMFEAVNTYKSLVEK